MRREEQSVCSAGVRRWREGLLARLRGAARGMGSQLVRALEVRSALTSFADEWAVC